MDDRSAAAPTSGMPSPQATGTAEVGGFFAVLEAVALAALGLDATALPGPSDEDGRDLATTDEPGNRKGGPGGGQG